VRITTDRRDAFDLLAAATSRLPGARARTEWFAARPRLRRWAWFVAIYGVSVVVFAAVAFFLNAIVPK
jgi:hypothetical protein